MRGVEYAKEVRPAAEVRGRRICKTERVRNDGAGRRQICKAVGVLGAGIERREAR